MGKSEKEILREYRHGMQTYRHECGQIVKELRKEHIVYLSNHFPCLANFALFKPKSDKEIRDYCKPWASGLKDIEELNFCCDMRGRLMSEGSLYFCRVGKGKACLDPVRVFNDWKRHNAKELGQALGRLLFLAQWQD